MAKKKKLNVRFLALVLGVLSIGVAGIGAFVVVQYRNDPVKHIRRGDDLLAAGNAENAAKQYSRGVFKAPFEMSYYDKWMEAIEAIEPRDENQSREMLNTLFGARATKARNASADDGRNLDAKQVREEAIRQLLDDLQVYTLQIRSEDIARANNIYLAVDRIMEPVKQGAMSLGPDELDPGLKAALEGLLVEKYWKTALGLERSQWEEAVVSELLPAIETDPTFVPTQYGLLRGQLDRFEAGAGSKGRTGAKRDLENGFDARMEIARVELGGEIAPEIDLLAFDRDLILYYSGLASDAEDGLAPVPSPDRVRAVEEGIAAIAQAARDGAIPMYEARQRLIELRDRLVVIDRRVPVAPVDPELTAEIRLALGSAALAAINAVYELDPSDLRNVFPLLIAVRQLENAGEILEAIAAVAENSNRVGTNRFLRTGILRLLRQQEFELAVTDAVMNQGVTDELMMQIEAARSSIYDEYVSDVDRDQDPRWNRIDLIYNVLLSDRAKFEGDSLMAKEKARRASRAAKLAFRSGRALDARALDAAISAAKTLGDFGSAVELFRTALELDPALAGNLDLQIQFIELLVEAGRTREAADRLTAIRRSLADTELDVELTAELAKLQERIIRAEGGTRLADLPGVERLVEDQKALASGNIEQRRQILQELIEDSATNRAVKLEAAIRLSRLEMAEGNSNASRQYARQALEIDPGNLKAKMMLSTDLDSSPLERARSVAEIAYEDQQDIDVGTIRSIKTLLQVPGNLSVEEMSELKAAVVELDARVRNAEELRLPALEYLLQESIEARDFARSNELIDLMESQLGGESTDTLVLRAQLLEVQGKLGEAIVLLEQSLDQRGYSSDRMARVLGDLLSRAGEREKALERYDQAFEQAPSRWKNSFPLAEALINDGRLNDALQVLRAARVTGRNDADFRDLWLMVEMQAGNYDVATKERRRLFELDPLDESNSIGLVQLLAEAPIDRESVVHRQTDERRNQIAGEPRFTRQQWNRLDRLERQQIQIQTRDERRAEANRILAEMIAIDPTSSQILVGANRFGRRHPEFALPGDPLADAVEIIEESLEENLSLARRTRLKSRLALIKAEQGINAYQDSGLELAMPFFEEAVSVEADGQTDAEVVISSYLISQSEFEAAAEFQTFLLAKLEEAERESAAIRPVAAQLARIYLQTDRLDDTQRVISQYFGPENQDRMSLPLYGGLAFKEAKELRQEQGMSSDGGLPEAALARLAEAESFFREMLLLDARNVEALSQLALIAKFRWMWAEESERAETFEQALAAYELLSDQNRSSWPIRRSLVDLYRMNDLPEEAILEIRQFLEVKPDETDARARLVIFLEELQQFDEALEVAQASLERDPANTSWAQMVANLRGKKNEWDEAAVMFANLYEQTGEIGFLRSQVGSLMRREEPAAAQVIDLARINQRQFALDPNLIGGYCAALAGTGRRADGLRQFESAYRATRSQDRMSQVGLARWLSELFPKTHEGVTELEGYVEQISDGRPAVVDLMEVSGAWDQVARLFPDDQVMHRQRAIDMLRRAIDVGKDDPGLAGVFIQLGVLLTLADDCEGAQEAFEEVLALKPGDIQIINNLAYIAVECGGDLDLALERAEKAVLAQPQKSEYRDTLGVVLFARARALGSSDPAARDLLLTRAENELKQASRLSQLPTPMINLAELHLFTDRPDKARRAIAEASDRDKNGRYRERINSLLEQTKDG